MCVLLKVAGHQIMHAFSLLTGYKFSVYEDFLKICSIKEVRHVELSTVYSKINTGQLCHGRPNNTHYNIKE